MANIQFIENTSHGRRYQVLDENSQPILGRYIAKTSIGEQYTSDGAGGFVPFLLQSETNEIQYGVDENKLELATNEQIIKRAGQVICSSFKFFVQANVDGVWVD